METLISACGLVCSNCKAYIATKTYNYDLVVETADEWSRMFHVTVEPKDVWCTGCMSASGPKSSHCSSGCEIRKCALAKEYNTCAACAEFPCAKVGHIADHVPGAKDLLLALKKCEG